MDDNRSIFVIVPCYNESKVIRQTIKTLLDKHYSVVVVDDASSDKSWEQLKDLPLYYLRHRVNLGQGAALQTGIDFARKKNAAYYVTFDADGQHDADDIPGMMEMLSRQKADIVFGSRFLPGSKTNVSVSRGFVLNLARFVNFLVSGILLSDAYNGLRIFNRKTADLIRLTENKMAHATQFLILVAKHHIRYAEFPNSIHYSDYSRKKGLKNVEGMKIFFEILLYKIFR